MSPRTRKAAAVLSVANCLAIVAASALVGVFGGGWLEFATVAFLLCLTVSAIFVLPRLWNASKRPVCRPQPRPRWREREGSRDGYVSDGDGPEVCITHPDGGPVAEGLERLIADGRVWDPDVAEILGRQGNRDRRAS